MSGIILRRAPGDYDAGDQEDFRDAVRRADRNNAKLDRDAYFTAGARIILTESDGTQTIFPTALSNYQPLDADLTNIAALSTTGLLARTGAATYATRTLTGTANEITVTNGDGVSGAPTFSLPTALTFTSKTVTGGTFSGITLSGTTTLPGSGAIDSSGNVGVGVASPSAKMHIRTATTGTPSYDAGADEMVLENTGACGLTIVAGATQYANIFLGDVDNTFDAAIRYFNNNGNMEFWTSAAVRLFVNAGTAAPGADDTQSLGVGSLRWSELFCANSTINTSDAREKTEVRSLTPGETAAAKALAQEIGAFKFLVAIDTKGAGARTHIGMTVQRAVEIMKAHGLDPFAYGFICHNAWGADAATGVKAGERYGFRHDQLNLFIARGFEARLSALEAAIG